MKLEIALIRHGQVQNGDKKLIGMTDNPLGKTGERLVRTKLKGEGYPKAELVFSSGLSRCYETAGIIYQNVPIVVMKELQAMDYGNFEGKSINKLMKDESFVKWTGMRGISACPNGEEPYVLQARSIAAFRRIVDEMAGKGLNRSSIISHKMIIREILHRYYVPRTNYREWEISHGGGYILRYDTITSTAEIAGMI